MAPSLAYDAAGVDGVRGFGGADAQISAVAWTRYYLRPRAAGSANLDLVREVRLTPQGEPTTTEIVADDVADMQISFCIDATYDPRLPAQPMTPQCGIEAEAAINDAPERIRTATILIRTRSKSEDPTALAQPESPQTWYDLDGNPGNGVARVRSFVCAVGLPNLGR